MEILRFVCQSPEIGTHYGIPVLGCRIIFCINDPIMIAACHCYGEQDEQDEKEIFSCRVVVGLAIKISLRFGERVQ
jgi:hypothetical protein